MKKSFISVILTVVAFSVAANPGQYQINQACIDVGCFSGDNPATKTIEINQSAGTFVLTSNIEFTDAENGAPAILVSNGEVQGSKVTIDLNGFQIHHTGIADSATNGIQIEGRNSVVSVRNGKIVAFQDGIQVLEGATVIVENMVFRIQRDDAIQATRAIIRNNYFNANAYGVFATSGPAGVGNEQLGERIYLDSNVFTDGDGSQDAVSSFVATSYCKDNLIAYDDSNNFGACSLAGDNMCDSSICTVVRSPIEDKE
jgi:hypothetical protein